MRRTLGLLVACAATLVLALPAAASAREPILFVHGWSGASWNWDYFVSKFQADGYPSSYLNNWSYDSSRPNTETAYKIRDKVNAIRAATGAAKVDIVTHSMGGLSSRYYLKALGGQPYVDEWVSLGGPNHGTNLSYICGVWNASCWDMMYGSSLLTYLNSGDETPGAVRYGTFRSWCDEVINPDDSTILSGASNYEIGCWGHIAMLGSSSVYTAVRNFVQ